jgi:hypothetical protein
VNRKRCEKKDKGNQGRCRIKSGRCSTDGIKPEMRKTFGVKGRQILEERYSLKRYAEKYSRIIRHMIK